MRQQLYYVQRNTSDVNGTYDVRTEKFVVFPLTECIILAPSN